MQFPIKVEVLHFIPCTQWELCSICLLMNWSLKFLYINYEITVGSDCFSLTLLQLYTLQLSQGLGPSCEVYIGGYLLCKLNKRRLFIRAAYGI